MGRKYILIVFMAMLITTTNVCACDMCISDALWMSFPKYNLWIDILIVYYILIVLLKEKNNIKKTKTIVIWGIISYLTHNLGAMFGWIAIIVLSFKIIKRIFPIFFESLKDLYYYIFKKKESKIILTDKVALIAGIIVIILLIIIYHLSMLEKEKRGLRYILENIFPSSGPTMELRNRIVRNNLMIDKELIEMLKSNEFPGSRNAELILFEKRNPVVIENLMKKIKEESKIRGDYEIYWKDLIILKGYNKELNSEKSKEWIEWWEKNQKK